jgi:hypothetical protein
VTIVENKVGLLSLCRCFLKRPAKQRGNRRFVLNSRVAHLAPYENRSQLFSQRRSMPKIKRKEDDKGSQDMQIEHPSNKPSRNTQKASGRDSAIQLPLTNTPPTAGGVYQSSPICSSAGASILPLSHLSMACTYGSRRNHAINRSSEES